MNKLTLVLVALFATVNTVADDDNSDSRTVTISKTLEFKHKPQSALCNATAGLDYVQWGVEAQVDTVVEVEKCDDASGQYVVKLSVRSDTDGQTRVLEFDESWSRSDGAPFALSKRYPIGQDVELKKVRIRKLSCKCADHIEEDGDD